MRHLHGYEINTSAPWSTSICYLKAPQIHSKRLFKCCELTSLPGSASSIIQASGSSTCSRLAKSQHHGQIRANRIRPLLHGDHVVPHYAWPGTTVAACSKALLLNASRSEHVPNSATRLGPSD